MKIGIDQFSYHRYFGEVTRWEVDVDVRWTVTDFINRAAALKVEAVSFQTHFISRPQLKEISHQCSLLNLAWIVEWGHPDGLKMGTSPDAVADLVKWLEATSELGGRLVRIVAGYPTYRGREPVEIQMARLVPILRQVSQTAADLGLVLALENHADFTPFELADLIEQVGMGNLRATFDTGNCVRLDADLLNSAQRITPMTAMVHLKDLWILEDSRGKPTASWPTVPLGCGMLDIARVLKILRSGGFDGYLLIEMAHMHPSWPDEDKAVAESVLWLRNEVDCLTLLQDPTRARLTSRS